MNVDDGVHHGFDVDVVAHGTVRQRADGAETGGDPSMEVVCLSMQSHRIWDFEGVTLLTNECRPAARLEAVNRSEEWAFESRLPGSRQRVVSTVLLGV